jgi:hypothetical protein
VLLLDFAMPGTIVADRGQSQASGPADHLCQLLFGERCHHRSGRGIREVLKKPFRVVRDARDELHSVSGRSRVGNLNIAADQIIDTVYI